MPYANGQIPLNLLIKTASGWNADGYWEHLWSPGTLAKWQALVADVLANEGVLLYVTPGWNAYRPLEPQKLAKKKYGPLAAWPGTSSHGGEYNGVPSMAIDCANWREIGQAKFFAYAKKHGLVPGTFEREPWHLIDYQPWAKPVSNGSVDLPLTPTIPPEVIAMATEVIVTFKDNNHKPLADDKRRAAFVNTESGFAAVFSWLTLADAEKWAKQVGMPAGAIQFSDSGFDRFIAAAAAVK